MEADAKYILTFSFSVGIFVYGLFAWIDAKLLESNKKESVSLWLMGASNISWSKHFCEIFDKIFGKKHLSLRCFFCSCAASIITMTGIYLMLGPVFGVLNTYIPDDRPFIQVLVLGLLINLIPDYISLFETRKVLELFQCLRSRFLKAFVLIADLLFSGFLILLSIYIWFAFTNESGTEVAEIIGGFSIYSIFFILPFLRQCGRGYMLSQQRSFVFSITICKNGWT